MDIMKDPFIKYITVLSLVTLLLTMYYLALVNRVFAIY